jgi:hypothetical protein
MRDVSAASQDAIKTRFRFNHMAESDYRGERGTWKMSGQSGPNHIVEYS